MEFQDFTQSISDYMQASSGVAGHIVFTLIVIFALWLLRLVLIRIINRNLTNKRQRYSWRKNVSYIIGVISLLCLGAIWFEGLQSIGTFLGLFAAGLAIALRGPLTDIAAWIYIAIRKPFKIGDRIQIGENKGDIIDLRLFKFTILEIGNWVQADQSTGRIIHMPNHKVFSEPLANYTGDFEFIWNELHILVTFDSDWKKAKIKLQEIADHHLKDFIDHAESQVRRASKSYLIHYKYLTPIVYTDVKESGIDLTIRHLCDPRQRRGIQQAIWEDTLDLVEKYDDINLAYPTMHIITSRDSVSKGTSDASNK